MARRTHPEGNEGYTAMKKALRQNPKVAGQMLKRRLEDTRRNLAVAASRSDTEAVSKLSQEIAQIESAQQKLALRAASKDAETEENAPEDSPAHFGDSDEEETDEEASETGDTAGEQGQGLGFGKPPAEEPSETLSDNPVAMTSTLRRQVGDSAADFLDDYALTVYEKVMQFIDKLREVALILGAGEDDEDGITSLREALKDEIGRRGLEAVEPVYDEWLQGVFRTITKEMRGMFEVPEAPVDLSDSEVGQLLGLDDVAEAVEVADEGEKDGKLAEEAEAEAVKTNARAAPQVPAVSISEALRKKDAPLAMATGPISLRIGSHQPAKAAVSAAVPASKPQKATDFVPSGHSTHRLE